MAVLESLPYEAKVRELVKEHLALEDEPLLLAVYYTLTDNPGGIYLLEVIENFGVGDISEDRELFEVTFGSSEGFPLPPGQRLHLLLTNPEEAKVAFQEEWTGTGTIRGAIRNGDFRTLYSHPNVGEALMAILHG